MFDKGSRSIRTGHLDLFDDAEPADDLAEDDVLVVQPVRLLRRDEELRSVGARPRVGHREDAGLGVLQLEVLVGKLLAVDGAAAGAVAIREVAALDHEVRDDAVE